MQVFLTALGAFLGAFLSILASMFIEYLRKPKLELTIENPPVDQGAPAKRSRFVRVLLSNKPMPRAFRWLGRSAAYQCTGSIQFHHLEDGAAVFSRAMPARWVGADEPVSHHMSDDKVVQLFDAAKYNAAFRRDCFPGTQEILDVAARFDDDDECFGWSNESYLPGKSWPRNPDFKLPKGRYLVKVTINSSGDTVTGLFKLENSVSRQHFRLLPASEDDAAKLRQQY